MSLISDGISQVRAFSIPAGFGTASPGPASPQVAIVRWQSSHDDKLHQVYVNGVLAGTTLDANQRQMVVHIPASLQTAARIEVFATDPADAWLDQYENSEPPQAQLGQVRLSFARLNQLPADAHADYFFDNGSGKIDYEQKLNSRPVNVWPGRAEQGGFALSRFGLDAFGFDGAAGPGFGLGCFGLGEFGFDADELVWQSPQLAAGRYKFGIKLTDGFGNAGEQAETETVTVIPPAKPAAGVFVYSYDKQKNELVLGVE